MEQLIQLNILNLSCEYFIDKVISDSCIVDGTYWEFKLDEVPHRIINECTYSDTYIDSQELSDYAVEEGSIFFSDMSYTRYESNPNVSQISIILNYFSIAEERVDLYQIDVGFVIESNISRKLAWVNN